MATSMKLALVTLGISQQRIIRAAAKQGRKINASRLSDIVNGKARGTDNERQVIAEALNEVGVPAGKALELLAATIP